MSIVPLKSGRGDIELFVFGRKDQIKINRSNPESFRPIVEKLPEYVNRVWAPSPAQSNAAIVAHSDYREIANLDTIPVMGKVSADGVCINRSEAFAITSADCPTIIAYGRSVDDKPHLYAAHAGRDSLVDRTLLTKGSFGRKDFGIVFALIREMTARRVQKEDINIKVLCGIRSGFYHPPTHPTFGSYNKKLIDYCKKYPDAVRDEVSGEIDLYELIRGQAIAGGILWKNISFDRNDTGSQEDLASYRRNKEERNLVLVCRT
jgi:copper oxidase (laccase) domain-containing protein